MLLVLLKNGMGKKMAQLIPAIFPPMPPSNMRAVAKNVITMEKLFLFGQPLPSLLKTTQVQHLKPDSAKEAYLSSTQHADNSLSPTYNTFVQPSIMFAACGMLQPHDQLVYRTFLRGTAACPILIQFSLTHLIALIKA